MYYERLPTCPLCLEKLDTSVSGLQMCMLYETFPTSLAPETLNIYESDFETGEVDPLKLKVLNQIQWPFLEKNCQVCLAFNQSNLDEESFMSNQLICRECD